MPDKNVAWYCLFYIWKMEDNIAFNLTLWVTSNKSFHQNNKKDLRQLLYENKYKVAHNHKLFMPERKVLVYGVETFILLHRTKVFYLL